MTLPSATSRPKQVAYLAGPMRGIPEYNFPAFFKAAAELRMHGLDVWSPAEHDVNQDGFDPAKDTAQPMKHYMRRDLPAVLDADIVCVLPGWENSQGARLEVHVAQACGIPVYNAHDFSPVSTVSEIASSRPERVDTAEMVLWLQRFTDSEVAHFNDRVKLREIAQVLATPVSAIEEKTEAYYRDAGALRPTCTCNDHDDPRKCPVHPE